MLKPVLPGTSVPEASFEVPLEMLSACHHRVENQCATLRRLVAHLAQHGADADARSAASAVMRYFDSAARDHHADEEVDLFPALIESMAGSDAVCLRGIVSGLTEDHRALEALWRDLRIPLQAIANGEIAALASPDIEPFITRYERHIEREEKELLPMVARLLSDDALAQIGRAMRERRGIAALG